MSYRQRIRERLGRQVSDELDDKPSPNDGQHDREDEAARKRAELEVLRRIREVGYWWPDGS